ncbi:hypothetical protein N7512_000369 [Penicillium capsulatum]|nr:hypothetical protein N7512_000369 [Penicillium capsulatum]
MKTPILSLALMTLAAHPILADVPSGAFPASSATPATPSSPARLGGAVIQNHCKTPIYIWSVGSTVRPQKTILPYARYYETFRKDVHTGGIALKISTERDGLYTSAPQTIFAYNLVSPDRVWYDLSDVFGDAFRGHPVSLQPSEPRIYWADGVPPAGSQTRVHDPAVDLVLTLC